MLRHSIAPGAIARGIAVLLMALIGTLQPATAQSPPGEPVRDYGEFYEALEPHGRWIAHPDHGYVWAPEAAADDEDWRPYSRGHWVATEEHGWYWVSDEPFGWAVYHYGRWLRDEREGWIWIPGSEWAPAWVAWRDGEDYVGWAPLPPEATWDGVALSYRADIYDAPRFAPYWVFVPPRYLVVPGLYRYAVPVSRNHHHLRSTRIVTDYRIVDRRIFNRGIDPRLLEQRTARPVPFARIAPGHSPRDHGISRGDRSLVTVYRPTLQAAPASPVLPPVTQPSGTWRGRFPDAAREERRSVSRHFGDGRPAFGARSAGAPPPIAPRIASPTGAPSVPSPPSTFNRPPPIAASPSPQPPPRQLAGPSSTGPATAQPQRRGPPPHADGRGRSAEASGEKKKRPPGAPGEGPPVAR